MQPRPGDQRARVAVERLWLQFRPLVDQRVALVEAHADGTGDAAAAAQAAHTLAGTLGTYGRPDGSAVARRIEDLLREDAPPEVLREAVHELRRTLGPA